MTLKEIIIEKEGALLSRIEEAFNAGEITDYVYDGKYYGFKLDGLLVNIFTTGYYFNATHSFSVVVTYGEFSTEKNKNIHSNIKSTAVDKCTDIDKEVEALEKRLAELKARKVS